MIALILGTPFAYPIPCGRERVTSTLGFIDRILLGCPEFYRYGVSRRGKKPVRYRSGHFRLRRPGYFVAPAKSALSVPL